MVDSYLHLNVHAIKVENKINVNQWPQLTKSLVSKGWANVQYLNMGLFIFIFLAIILVSDWFMALDFLYMAHQITNPIPVNQTMINEHAKIQNLETTYLLNLCKGPATLSTLGKLL